MTASAAATDTKCPCCNNPWARATEAWFGGSGGGMCGECVEVGKGLSRKNLDETVSPQDNFYRYANGGWIAANPIPPGYPNWNSFLTLHVQSQERCKELLENLKEDNGGEEPAKVAAFYTAAMDEDAVEALGAKPLEPVISLIQDMVAAQKDASKFATLLGKLDADYGVSPFFAIGASPDAKNSSHTICQLYQGGLGLPDRDYYFDEDKADKRSAYVTHIANMLALLWKNTGTDASGDEDAAAAAAQAVMDLETNLAQAHMTRTENRDPHATYNKMTVEELDKFAEFPLSAYLKGSTGMTSTEIGDVNVRNKDAIRAATDWAMTIDSATLKNYLLWHMIKSYAPYLSKAFVDENFDFYEKTLSGTDELKPRWKRAMAFTETALGEALGKLYCEKYFDAEAKASALAIVDKVLAALKERLTEVEWMKSDSTRQEALKKMSAFGVKIGYPDKWIDYSSLVIEPSDTFCGMIIKSRAFHHRRCVKEMNAPTDRTKWFMTPQTVNAYYHPSLNEIVFPAALLQHPFFDKDADDAVNFGAMGAVIGHECTHGFDDKGRKFDAEGVLNDWWTEEDAAEYEKRVDVMVEQANAFEVHGKKVQGKLTSGENIADLGGLRLALRALKAQENFDPNLKIDGFTPVQRFFLSWAQCWRQNITKERAIQLVTVDPHGPNEMRCNGPLSNMAEFHEAFGVKEDSPMYKPKDGRVDIW